MGYHRRELLAGCGALLVSGCAEDTSGDTTEETSEQLNLITVKNRTDEPHHAEVHVIRDGTIIHEQSVEVGPWQIKNSTLVQGQAYLQGEYLDEVGDYRLAFSVQDKELEKDVSEENADPSECFRASAEIIPTGDDFTLYIGSYADDGYC